VNTGSGGRHRSSTANPDASRLHEDDFAATVAAHLNHEVLAGRIERLFVIADPRTLGEVRRHLHKETSARLAGDLAKNLTGHGTDDIAAALLAA
jgi:protein required for attachment to host cells